MQTRRDQLQAYRYQVRRVLTALLGSDPDSPEQPMRRVATATLSGVMVAVLALAGAGFYGKVRGGSPSKWQQAGVIIVERDTGSRYIYADKQLHPVLNYTSARLLLDAANVPTVQVARTSLAGAARGATVGVAGAPDSLPDAKHLIVGPWSVCTQPAQATAGPGQTGGNISTLTIGESTGGAALGNRAMLVRSSSTVYLIWHGKRLRTDSALVAKYRAGFATGVEGSRKLAQRRTGWSRPAATRHRIVGPDRADGGRCPDECGRRPRSARRGSGFEPLRQPRRRRRTGHRRRGRSDQRCPRTHPNRPPPRQYR